ncbi:MAG: MotA/TolQ/ExbB proton channel family protein [Pelosinus sp.]|nr:MotA/TolQ/ExbB proton channel family protein [Pelosinus sp.]
MDVLIKGGWVILPLLFCSLVAVTIIIERITFFRNSKAPEKAERVLKSIEQGNIAEAYELTKSAQIPILRILSAGIFEHTAPAKAMEAAAIKEISAMKRGLAALDTIITLSPLLGLLGTIIGMIGSFQVMAVGGLGQPHAVTGGVAEALIATATGISVAVVTLIPYNYFQARIEKETESIEHFATRLEIALEKAPRSEDYENSKKYA